MVSSNTVTGTSYTVTGLTQGTQYWYLVDSQNADNIWTSGCNSVTGTTVALFNINTLPKWAWFKADAGITGTTSVTNWADQSGNGRNLVSISGKEPVLQTNAINSLPVVKTGSAVAAMNTVETFPDTERAISVYIVAKQKVGSGALDDSSGMFISTGENSLVIQRKFSGGSNNNIYSQFKLNTLSSVQANDTFFTIRYLWQSAASEMAINNVQVGTDASFMSDLGSTALFAFSKDGSTQYGNKEIAEIIICTSAHDSATKDNVESYLRTKYGHY